MYSGYPSRIPDKDPTRAESGKKEFMAKKVTVQLVDDLDGTPIPDGEGATVVFSIDRRSYEIDLSDENQEKLRDALAPFIDAGRVVSSGSSSPRTRTSSSRPASNGHDLTAVRAWARENGHKVSDRGRVPATVLEAYDAANSGKSPGRPNRE
jgi:hypothetical protein